MMFLSSFKVQHFQLKGGHDVIVSNPHQTDRLNLCDDNLKNIHFFDIVLLLIIVHFQFPTTYQKLFFDLTCPLSQNMNVGSASDLFI